MTTLLSAIEIETAANPEYAVIWMHGLGADGGDFAPVVPYLGLKQDLRVRFIFPHAPSIPVTCNGGYVMPAWYDIMSIERLSRAVDEKGLLKSCAAVRQLIRREEERGIPAERIVIAGFSQGGAMAYTLGLTHPQRLAGIIALSAYIPAPQLLVENEMQANRTTPIFAGHGLYDDVVGLELGEQAQTRLADAHYPVEWHTYPIPHSVCEEEIADIGAWLNARFSA